MLWISESYSVHQLMHVISGHGAWHGVAHLLPCVLVVSRFNMLHGTSGTLYERELAIIGLCCSDDVQCTIKRSERQTRSSLISEVVVLTMKSYWVINNLEPTLACRWRPLSSCRACATAAARQYDNLLCCMTAFVIRKGDHLERLATEYISYQGACARGCAMPEAWQ